MLIFALFIVKHILFFLENGVKSSVYFLTSRVPSPFTNCPLGGKFSILAEVFWG